jgi:hypothetical protein
VKKPSVKDCLDEIERLRAENKRLKRLAATQRPELAKLREVEVQLRDVLGFNGTRLQSLHEAVKALMGTDDDLPNLLEMCGILSDGKERVDAAVNERHSAAAPPTDREPT